ncbi:hypothetical protein [uncultured Bdellovibrio sp.]|uniref:hypothetical protein n=1 Tax=Bdellovibrio sp. HCB-162 TaxID=3394234 RepID=UPI0025CEECA5|nr:hypothetical protein [uncultured Bdellovibrio sp.]
MKLTPYILLGVAAGGAAAIAWGYNRKKQNESSPRSEKVDQASEESFPASDAPSWAGGE